jgi:hypothetical protein
MPSERSYRTYEEFEREELRSSERLGVSFEDLLGEFDGNSRQRGKQRGVGRQGLFDSFDQERGLDDE